MPAFGKMSDEKNTAMPVMITEVTPSAPKPRNTKKYVIIAVSGISLAVIILAAILVGMYMFNKGQQEIREYTMKMNDNTKQDVTSDPNENVVKYHVSNATTDTWIVNDFGRDLQVMKITSDHQTNCFVSPLNRTNLLDPSKINGPESTDVKEFVTLMYRSSNTPVSDPSFLGKTARELCKGISVYWLYPQCIDNSGNKGTNITEGDHPRSKRGYVCVTNCCYQVCSQCTIHHSWYTSGGRRYCNWSSQCTLYYRKVC